MSETEPNIMILGESRVGFGLSPVRETEYILEQIEKYPPFLFEVPEKERTLEMYLVAVLTMPDMRLYVPVEKRIQILEKFGLRYTGITEAERLAHIERLEKLEKECAK